MRRVQTPLPCKTGNQHLHQNMPIETAFGCQRARSALSKTVLKPRHNTLILLPNSAEIGTTCCLQPWGKWAWNCSASEKKILTTSLVPFLSFQPWLWMWHLPSGTSSKAKEAQGHSLPQGCTSMDLQAGMYQGGDLKGLPQSWGIWRPCDPLKHLFQRQHCHNLLRRESSPLNSYRVSAAEQREELRFWVAGAVRQPEPPQFVPAGPSVPKLTVGSCPSQLLPCSC